MLVIVRHQADSEPLVVTMSFAKGAVDDFPAVFSGLRLELRPEPAQICDAGSRKIHRARRRIRKCRLRPNLGPRRSFVQFLPDKAIEGLDPHPGIYQDVVDFGWTNNCGLRDAAY